MSAFDEVPSEINQFTVESPEKCTSGLRKGRKTPSPKKKKSPTKNKENLITEGGSPSKYESPSRKVREFGVDFADIVNNVEISNPFSSPSKRAATEGSPGKVVDRPASPNRRLVF